MNLVYIDHYVFIKLELYTNLPMNLASLTQTLKTYPIFAKRKTQDLWSIKIKQSLRASSTL